MLLCSNLIEASISGHNVGVNTLFAA